MFLFRPPKRKTRVLRVAYNRQYRQQETNTQSHEEKSNTKPCFFTIQYRCSATTSSSNDKNYSNVIARKYRYSVLCDVFRPSTKPFLTVCLVATGRRTPLLEARWCRCFGGSCWLMFCTPVELVVHVVSTPRRIVAGGRGILLSVRKKKQQKEQAEGCTTQSGMIVAMHWLGDHWALYAAVTG